jgi:hypothetical protein
VVPSAFSTHESPTPFLLTATTVKSRATSRRCRHKAHEKMRENGVPVPRSQTKRAKAYVTRKTHGAISRGAKHIDPAARRFASMKTEMIAEAKRKAKTKRGVD